MGRNCAIKSTVFSEAYSQGEPVEDCSPGSLRMYSMECHVTDKVENNSLERVLDISLKRWRFYECAPGITNF